MTTLDVSNTLGELVTDNPARARVLERLHLDYCCKGGRSLADACTPLALDPQRVLADLLDVERAEVDWASLPPAQLADHIEQTHHAYLHAELPRLSTLVAKVTDVHGTRHRELADIATTYEDLRADLDPHLLKEERMLFPMIRDLATSAERPQFHGDTLQKAIAVLMAEHDRAGELFTQLLAQTDGYRAPEDGCASYRMLFAGFAELEADTHLHIHKENNVLFPTVVRLERERAGEVALSAEED